jgi:hypothetical protein
MIKEKSRWQGGRKCKRKSLNSLLVLGLCKIKKQKEKGILGVEEPLQVANPGGQASLQLELHKAVLYCQSLSKCPFLGGLIQSLGGGGEH